MGEIGWDEIGFMGYAKQEMRVSPVMFDVGYNIGDFSRAFFEKFPSAWVQGFEPIHVLYAGVLNDDARLQVHNLGLSDTTCTALIHYVHNSSGMSSLYNRAVFDEPTRGFQHKTCRVLLTTLDDWLEIRDFSEPIDYLKIDTEGHEFAVLRGAAHTLQSHRVKFIQFEYGGCWYESQTRLVEVVRYLDAFGYLVRAPDLQIIAPDNCPPTFWEQGNKSIVVNLLAEVKP